MKQNTVRLTEADLKNVIAESVKKVLKEIGDSPRGQDALSALAGRANARAKMARANGNQTEYWKQMDKFNDVDDYRRDAEVNSINQGKMHSWDSQPAVSKGFTYGIKKGMAESSKIQLKEDLFPDGIDITPARTAWEGISNALVNIQQYMDLKKSEFNREHELEQGVLKDIGNEDVEELVNYIHLTLNNVLKSTLPDLMK